MTSDDRPDSTPGLPQRNDIGQWEWDEWKQEALAAGIPEALANLGRAVIRERLNHAWSGTACRLSADLALLEALRRAPQAAERLCHVLLETDGLRWLFPETDCGELIEF